MKIKISRHIYRNCQTNELGCWAHKYIKIPYAPFVGLSIHDGKGDIMEIKLIQYDSGNKEITCFVGSQDHDDYSYAKKCAEEWGWKLREVPEGNKGISDLTNYFLGSFED